MTDVLAAINAMEPVIRKGFLAAISDIKSEAQLSVIIRALEDGRIDDVIKALHLTEEFFAPLDDAMAAAYIEGGRTAMSGLPVIPDRAGLGKLLLASAGATHGRRGG